MGYMIVLGPCVNCRQIFAFNPDKVPSVMVEGKREPICEPCVHWANPIRKRKGLPEIEILPDAYEPQDDGYGP